MGLPFSEGSPVCPPDRQTQTTQRATCSNSPHLALSAVLVMRAKLTSFLLQSFKPEMTTLHVYSSFWPERK